MRAICAEVKIPLADNCPLAEKAFKMVTRGTVLGVGFDSERMEWYLSREKADKVVRRCLTLAASQQLDLKQIQQVMGSVNDIAQMAPLLRFFKRSGNAFLKKFNGNENILLAVPEEVKSDMAVIAKVAESSTTGLPIASKQFPPKLSAIQFYTDAARASFSVVRGKRFYHNNKGKGVSCIAGSSKDDVWGWTRLSWPDKLLTETRDEKGIFYGSKSTFLESIGMLLPLLTFPHMIWGRDIVFMIDNAAVMFGWYSYYVSNDRSAFVVLRSVQLLAGLLGVRIHVKHVNRMSSDLANLADELSRKESCFSTKGSEILSNALYRGTEGALLKWLEDPSGSDMSRLLIGELREKYPML